METRGCVSRPSGVATDGKRLDAQAARHQLERMGTGHLVHSIPVGSMGRHPVCLAASLLITRGRVRCDGRSRMCMVRMRGIRATPRHRNSKPPTTGDREACCLSERGGGTQHSGTCPSGTQHSVHAPGEHSNLVTSECFGSFLDDCNDTGSLPPCRSRGKDGSWRVRPQRQPCRSRLQPHSLRALQGVRASGSLLAPAPTSQGSVRVTVACASGLVWSTSRCCAYRHPSQHRPRS